MKMNFGVTGFEPATPCPPDERATAALHPVQDNRFGSPQTGALTRLRHSPFRIDGAGDRVRTGDIQIGNLTLYQLSYTREIEAPERTSQS